MFEFEKLVDLERGLVSNDIFSDQEIYRLELERVFGKCWLFLAHESLIPNRGDYITNYMGEDAVVVCRDLNGKVRAFLNKCRHRGNKLCLYDRGRTASFTCSYHGWAYNTQGKLTGVPFYEEAYLGKLDKEQWGLVEVPRVETYGGLIFGCWDAQAISLGEYLGDLRWYLDHFLLVEYLGGLEIVPGKQRSFMVGNWKLLADNFAGDHYHFFTTHASFLKVLQEFPDVYRIDTQATSAGSDENAFEVTIGYQSGVPHGLGQLRIGADFYEHDLMKAERLGPEAVEWVKDRHRRLQEQLRDLPVQPYSFTRGNVFPNLSLIGTASALEGRGFILWQPRGPHVTEVWQWCAVEKSAPALVKQTAVTELMQRQAAGGLIAPDDHENFERITENVRTPVAKRWPFNYAMSLGVEDKYPGREEWQVESLPGLIGPRTTEVNQRQFYRYWAELMRRDA